MRRLYHVVVVVFVLAFSRLASAQPGGAGADASMDAAFDAPAIESPAAPPTAPRVDAGISAAATAPSEIRVHEKSVYVLRASRNGLRAAERAKAANTVLEGILQGREEDIGEARYEIKDGTAVVYVGKTPVVVLGPEDVEAAGESSLDVVGAQVTSRLAQAVSTERKRSAIATTVFSFSLLVFSALLAFLLFNRVSDIATRWRSSIGDNPERVTGIRLGRIEFVSAAAARGAVSIALALGYRLIQVTIAYGWLIFALSLFDATRGYTERLTGMVVKPLYGLATRIGGALPLVLVAAIAVVAVTVLVRFVGLFFDSIARGDTRVVWLSRDLARPTSALARFGIILVSLVLASPMITGEADGVISRVGLVALFAVALASTPLLASAVVGVLVVFGRKVKKGDSVEIAGKSGRVLDVTLFEIRLEDDALSEVTVPHLFGLLHVTRIHKHAPLTTIDVVVDAAAPQDEVERVLFEAARAMSSRGRVELVYLDGLGAHWRITSASMRHEVSLAKVVQDALARIGAGLGRGPAGSARASNGQKGAAEDT